MKTTTKIAIVMWITSLVALPLMARPTGFGVQVQIVAPPPPAVTVQVPAPAVTVQIGVPDSYVWDGYEYVGIVGDQYFYLGPNHVWIACDPVRLARFRGWEKGHMDWRTHATANVKYRQDAKGHEHPWHHDQGHDQDHNDRH